MSGKYFFFYQGCTGLKPAEQCGLILLSEVVCIKLILLLPYVFDTIETGLSLFSLFGISVKKHSVSDKCKVIHIFRFILCLF